MGEMSKTIYGCPRCNRFAVRNDALRARVAELEAERDSLAAVVAEVKGAVGNPADLVPEAQPYAESILSALAAAPKVLAVVDCKLIHLAQERTDLVKQAFVAGAKDSLVPVRVIVTERGTP